MILNRMIILLTVWLILVSVVLAWTYLSMPKGEDIKYHLPKPGTDWVRDEPMPIGGAILYPKAKHDAMEIIAMNQAAQKETRLAELLQDTESDI